MPRCNDCNRFVSLDSDQDPDSSIEVNESGVVEGDVTISNACADCGTELRTASFDVVVEPEALTSAEGKTLSAWLAELTEKEREEVEYELEETGTERTSRSEGKGRGQRTYYGAKIDFDVTATLPGGEGTDRAEGKSCVFSGSWSDDVQASGMDEC